MIKLLRPILDRAYFYELYHQIIGANYRSRILVSEYIRPRASDRVLDVGCGPGNMLPFLPKCQYMGVDVNPEYIATARRRYGKRGDFVCERVNHDSISEFGAFDIVLALGLTHHLDDDEARNLFCLGHAALKPGGRLITNDGCYTTGQSRLERYLLSSDRGRFVRTQEAYLTLAHTSFFCVVPHLRSDVLRIPYTHLIMECVRQA
ncbi:MAG TPA: class I SAM-dependent methyltransferase [Terriglobales bacterium]|nr:class I SAM-dependent methyltransferase [Terriglobales bacterium]